MTGDIGNKYPIPTDVRMYTREEVAEMIGCHKDHVVMLSEVGCLKSIRIIWEITSKKDSKKTVTPRRNGFLLSSFHILGNPVICREEVEVCIKIHMRHIFRDYFFAVFNFIKAIPCCVEYNPSAVNIRFVPCVVRLCVKGGFVCPFMIAAYAQSIAGNNIARYIYAAAHCGAQHRKSETYGAPA